MTLSQWAVTSLLATLFMTAGINARAEIIYPAPDLPKSSPIKQVVDSDKGSLWTGPAMNGVPIGIETGDFDGDGKQEIAVAFDDRVEIHRLIEGSLQQLATVKLGNAVRAYHLDGIDLNKNGRMELFVSTVSDSGNLAALVIEPEDGKYNITRKDIPWHLRSTTLPGEGSVLLGQKMGVQGREFSGPVFRVKLSKNSLIEGTAVELPRKTNLYDFAVLPDKTRKLFACLDDDGHLNIITLDGQTLASSVDPVGGNESYLEMNEEVQGGGESRASYFKARIEVNSKGEIFVPVNSGFTLLSRAKIYTKSELKAFKWNGSSLKNIWHTNPEKNYLADFRFSDAGNTGKESLITAVAFQKLNPFSDRKSVLHLYPLP